MSWFGRRKGDKDPPAALPPAEAEAMSNKARTLADTYVVLPGKSKKHGAYRIEIKRALQGKKMSLPSGRTVQAVSREVFENAVRAATLKE